jgi:hypothetical protein
MTGSQLFLIREPDVTALILFHTHTRIPFLESVSMIFK